MVATDVASRGIGMLERIFISFLFLIFIPILDVVWLDVDSYALYNALLYSFGHQVRAPHVSCGPLVCRILES